MTDALRPAPRAIPRVASPRVVPPRAASPRAGGDVTAGATDRAATRAATAEARRPYHLAVLLGLSAGAYAVTLAGVTALQASSERAAAELRAPAAATVAAAVAVHDALDRDLAALRSGLTSAGGDYERAVGTLAELEADLDGLAVRIAGIEGATARLPSRISLPSAPRVSAATKPATQSTTGASGR